MSRRGRRRRSSDRRLWTIGAVVLVALAIGGVALFVSGSRSSSTASSSATTSSSSTARLIILYINQGNGAVNQSNFAAMTSFATAHGFNTLFFQVYRSGSLLFDPQQLSSFVAAAHSQGLSIFFSLYITNSSETLPAGVYPLGENGISLDMSTLSVASQTALFQDLRGAYSEGKIAITTTDFALPLSPDILVIETYGTQYQQDIHHGVVASVGVFATSSKADYEQQLQYALQNSDGVMVFDYAGLIRSGY